MKAIIPMAGKGTRLRPHTYWTPKPLLRVAGRPVMSYLLDDLAEIGVTELVLVVGYLQDTVRAFMVETYPDLPVHYVVQEVQDGTAGAVKLGQPFIDGELIVLFADTLFDADLSMVKRISDDTSGVIWAKEVEDYQRFGVIVTDESGAMRTIVEKPTEPISKLANIGFYYIRDHELLFAGVDHALETPGSSGEYYLTDAFQYMVDHGARIVTAPVEGWYDCGKTETLLETNRHLVSTSRGGVSEDAQVEGSEIVEPVRIEEGVVVRNSTIGPNVTLERGVTVEESSVRTSMIGGGASIARSELHDSIVGDQAEVRSFRGSLSVLNHSVVEGG